MQNFTNFLFGGVPMQGGNFSQTFQNNYKCYSVAFLQRPDLEAGGKIIMPPSALDHLARLRIEYPMLFQLLNPSIKERKTHCGVLEFTAAEGTVGLPYWMMQNLLIEEGGFITIRSVTLPKGTYVKLQPQSSAFLDISNPKAVLEMRLRNFAALTQGDVIKLEYNSKNYYLSVLESKPSSAISIIETDVILDFAAPPDYKEPTPKEGKKEETKPQDIKKTTTEETEEEKANSFKAFTGTGYSLKGKTTPNSSPAPASTMSYAKPAPSTTATAPKPAKKLESDSESDSEEEDDKNKKFKAFSGTGYSLKGK